MLFNKDRMLRKMEEFDLAAVIATHPENVSYMSDLQSQLPYMYRFLNVEGFAFFSRRGADLGEQPQGAVGADGVERGEIDADLRFRHHAGQGRPAPRHLRVRKPRILPRVNGGEPRIECQLFTHRHLRDGRSARAS